MALVVLLKGINVGGHRAFRPSVLARDLSDLGVTNIGAAGTFVVRAATGRSRLREEIARRLPFEAEIVICPGADVSRLVSLDPFAGHASRPDVVRFVSAIAGRAGKPIPEGLTLPVDGVWGLRVLTRQGRFLVGEHRREMKAIGHLVRLESLVGAPLLTRGWSTILKIEDVLHA